MKIAKDMYGKMFDSIQYDEGLNYGDANQVSLGDRAPWGGWGHDGLTKSPHVKEEIFAIDEGVRYQPVASAIEAIDVGFNWTSRDKRKHVDEFDMNLKNGRLQTLVDPDFVRDATSLGFAGFGNVLASLDAAELCFDTAAVSCGDLHGRCDIRHVLVQR